MEKRVIQTVGVLLVLGLGLYFGAAWVVFPDAEVGENNISETQDGIENGGTDTGPTESSTGEKAFASTGCEADDDRMSIENYSGIGPPFDGRIAERMVHDALNELRRQYSSYPVENLSCDGEISEIAQEHSKAMSDGGFLGETPETGEEYGNVTERYGGVCESPREVRGRFLYQRDRNLNWDGPRLTQEDNIIKDHEEFSDDVRRVWSDRNRAIEAVTDRNATQQGVGVHIDRPSSVVYVTHTVC